MFLDITGWNPSSSIGGSGRVQVMGGGDGGLPRMEVSMGSLECGSVFGMLRGGKEIGGGGGGRKCNRQGVVGESPCRGSNLFYVCSCFKFQLQQDYESDLFGRALT